MTRRAPSRRSGRRAGLPAGASVGLVAAALLLGGCTGGDAGDGAATPTAAPTPDATATAYPEVGGDVPLAEPGSALALGDTAAVAWEPRDGLVGAVALRVTDIAQRPTSVLDGFRLDDAARASTPYFVRATVTNAGDTDLGGVDVPLYVVDDRDRLVQASRFASTFRACPSGPLPSPFTSGAQASVCLVYLVPDGATAAGVSFRPTQVFDPITWTGTIRGASTPAG